MVREWLDPVLVSTRALATWGERKESVLKRRGSQSEEGGTPKPSCLLYGFAEDSCCVTAFLLEGTCGRNYDGTFSCLPSLSHFGNFQDPQSCPSQGCSHLRILHARVERPDLLAPEVQGISEGHWPRLSRGVHCSWTSPSLAILLSSLSFNRC